MEFISKPFVVEATQWFKNGDHPLDDVYRPFEDTGAIPTEPREGAIVRYFRHPSINELSICRYCEQPMIMHGWIEGVTEANGRVCPGDWIIKNHEKYPPYFPVRRAIFEEKYYNAVPKIIRYFLTLLILEIWVFFILGPGEMLLAMCIWAVIAPALFVIDIFGKDKP